VAIWFGIVVEDSLCARTWLARIERLGIIASFDESELGLAIDWGGCDPAIKP
jgi:hypothetical protein